MIIGVVGKSGSGKNQVAEYIERVYGFKNFDLDKYGHRYLKENIDDVCDMFGTVSSGNLDVDRNRISNIVFNNPAKLKTLEATTHNWIEETLKIEADFQEDNIILNGAVLEKSGLYDYCDFIIFVEASFTTRLKRLKKRDSHKTIFQLLSRMRSQKDVNRKVYANRGIPCFILYNNKSLNMLYSCLEDYKFYFMSEDEKKLLKC